MIIEGLFFSKIYGIPTEEEIGDYYVIKNLKKDGWILNKPDPADRPDTGEEIRNENKY